MPYNHIRSLTYLIDEVSTQLNKPLFRDEISSKLDLKKVEELRNHVFNFLTSPQASERKESIDYLHKTLPELPILDLTLSKATTDQSLIDVVDVFIGMPKYSNYLSYLGQLPCRLLNNNALQYLQPVNNLLM